MLCIISEFSLSRAALPQLLIKNHLLLESALATEILKTSTGLGDGEQAQERPGCAALCSAVSLLADGLLVSGEITQKRPSASLHLSDYPLIPSTEVISFCKEITSLCPSSACHREDTKTHQDLHPAQTLESVGQWLWHKYLAFFLAFWCSPP